MILFLVLMNNYSKIDISPKRSEPIDFVMDDSSSKQIVSQNYKNTIKPKKSKFLGAHNQSVPKEQIHRSHKNLAMKDLMPKHSFQPMLDPNGDIASNSKKSLENSDKGSRSDDMTDKSLAEGNETLLNSNEFKYYSYYERIREQLASHWYGDIRSRMERLEREGHRVKFNKTTATVVTLDRKGNLVKVQLVNSSGLVDLDDSSLQAFKSANPFPHPPADLISSDGLVVIRWNFILELN